MHEKTTEEEVFIKMKTHDVNVKKQKGEKRFKGTVKKI